MKDKHMSQSRLVLASASPRRAQLLRQINLDFTVIRPDIDETPVAGEGAVEYVARMSAGKADAAIGLLGEHVRPDAVILCADTIVVLDGAILGKPRDEQDAVDMLLRMSGRDHHVLTSVTLRQQTESPQVHFQVDTQVTFRALSEGECRQYWRTGEPQDKSGSYGIQGIGAIFVASMSGSPSNVAGLPLRETAERLGQFGINCLVAAQ
jgi:septum formation protein